MIEWNILTTPLAVEMWDRIEKDVQDCLNLGLGTDVDTIKSQVSRGEMQVAIATEDRRRVTGSSVFRIINQGNRRIAYIVTITGKNIATNQSIDRLYERMRQRGADYLQCLCRPSAARLWRRFGLEPIHQLMEVKL